MSAPTDTLEATAPPTQRPAKPAPKRRAFDLALYRAVDEVLHYLWDPVGISSVPAARREYHRYIPQVFGMLRVGNDSHAIARCLSQIVTERMGLKDDPEHSNQIARVLLEWKEAVRDRHG
jgi:hypothetical protein